MKVPFIDLKAQYESIKDEINAAIQQVLDSCAFAGGPFVEKFEKEFAEFCQCQHCVGVGSGTEALWLSLLALGVGPRDEVITVPNTFIATAEAITFTGAKPVFVDVDEKTYNMDATLLEAAITPRTKAVVPVHLYGQMADMDPILEVALDHKLYVIEDACQAHGAEYKGRRAGSIGHTGCFSFYPGKNLGAYGEAGAIVTNDLELSDKLRILRDHGQPKKYHHSLIGWNCRMDGFQGAILAVKLRHISEWNEKRRQYAYLYNRLIADFQSLTWPREPPWAKAVYHLYVVRTRQRDALQNYLQEKGINTGLHYPVPLHLQHAYRSLEYNKGSFPVSERLATEILSLPMYPELRIEQQEETAKRIGEYFS
jgi:dTDP-4-amino-4,6-dideoxygalactose transaminase